MGSVYKPVIGPDRDGLGRRIDLGKFEAQPGGVDDSMETKVNPPINEVREGINNTVKEARILGRPSRGKRPPVKGKPLPVPPESEITSPVEIPEKDMDKEKPTAPEEIIAVEQQPKRRRRRAQDQSLVNTSNLLGTGGSL